MSTASLFGLGPVIASIAGGASWHFRPLKKRMWQLANALGKILNPDESIAVLARNCPEYFEILLAAPRVNDHLLLDPDRTPSELITALTQMRPSVLIVGAGCEALADLLEEKCPTRFTQLRMVDGKDSSSYHWLVSRGSWLPSDTKGPGVMYVVEEGGALATAGVTAGAVAQALPLSGDSRVLIPGPLHQAAGAMTARHAFTRGASIIVLPEWDATQFVAQLKTGGVTHTLITASMAKDLAELPAEVCDIPDTVKVILCDGSITEKVRLALVARFPEKIYRMCSEVAKILHAHPDVQEATAIDHLRPCGKRVVQAEVVLGPNATPCDATVAEIRAHCEDGIGSSLGLVFTAHLRQYA